MVGALWVANTGDEYTFDIAVSKEFQRLGIGKKLTEEAIRKYHTEGYEEIGNKMVIDCVNPKMVDFLKTKGFEITGREGSHTLMEYTNKFKKGKVMPRTRLTKIAAITSELDKIAEEVQELDPVAALQLDLVSDKLEGRGAAGITPFSKKLKELKAEGMIQSDKAKELVKAIEEDKPRLLQYAMAEFGSLQELQDNLKDPQAFYTLVQKESKKILKDKYDISGNYHLVNKNPGQK